MNKRPHFHFTPDSNWMNDPNGLSYYKGEFHLFYQHNPKNCYWGNMTWGHAKSKDLFNWEHLPYALNPDSKVFGDIDGCFSGSAIVEHDELILFYTGVEMKTKKLNEFGNVVTVGSNDLIPSQILAKSIDGINFKKVQKLSLELPKSYCQSHVRDPKVWRKDGIWYLAIGAKEDYQGRILIYKSKDMKEWQLLSIIKEENMGYMWECPDLFEIDDTDILLFSPEGIGKDGQVSISGYYTGKFNYENGEFKHNSFERLDYGFEFYAPQTFLDCNKRRILIGWLVNHAPLPNENWTGLMTLPREIKIKDGKVYMYPVEELKKYRIEELVEFSQLKGTSNTFDFEVTFKNLDNFKILLFKDNNNGLSLTYSSFDKKLILNRENVINGFKPLGTFGTIRECQIDGEKECTLRIIVDKCVAEIYINNGEKVMSCVVNPTSNQKNVEVIGNIISKKIYKLNK